MWRRAPLFVIALLLSAAAPPGLAEELLDYSGAQLYVRFCESCHGPSGEGDGPVAPFFKLAPPDLTRIVKRHGGEFPAEKMQQIIEGLSNVPPHGTRSMPVWGLEFMQAAGTAPGGRERARTLIARLVEYLRTLQRP